MKSGQHVDFLVLLVQQVLEFANLGFQSAHPFLQRLCVTSRKGTTAQFVASLALKADVQTLCATWADTVASDFLGATSVASLSDAGLGAGADLDHFHGQDAWHDGGGMECIFSFLFFFFNCFMLS